MHCSLRALKGGEQRVQCFEHLRKRIELCVVDALRNCHSVEKEKEKHHIAVAHFEQALETHCKGHVVIFPSVATGQHIAIPWESAWIMLQGVRKASPHKCMYACNEPYVHLGTGGLENEVTPIYDHTLLYQDFIDAATQRIVGCRVIWHG